MPVQSKRAEQWFAHFTDLVVGWLPHRGPLGFLGSIQPTLVGFLVLSASGFIVDVGFLALFVRLFRHTSLESLGLTYPVSVSLGYGIASVYNFVMNKLFNFQAHGHAAVQTGKWAAVAVSNYLLWILGLSWLLEHNGVPAVFARMLVIVIEIPWLYGWARWWVFRGIERPAREPLHIGLMSPSGEDSAT